MPSVHPNSFLRKHSANLPVIACCRHLAYQLSVNLLAYDYSGYGESTGEPSPSGCYSDIQACWDYLTQERGFKPEEIVLYGQSVGSGPTGHLAARQPKLKGCVFHSGIVSGKLPVHLHVASAV